MRIGILTSGGDAPGLNAVIRGIVRIGEDRGVSFIGFRKGYQGLTENNFFKLRRKDVRGISSRGGTILGTSRTSPFDEGNGGVERVKEVMALNDELTQANRKRAFVVGYTAMMLCSGFLFALSLFVPVAGVEAAHLILVVGVVAPLYSFAGLERVGADE